MLAIPANYERKELSGHGNVNVAVYLQVVVAIHKRRILCVKGYCSVKIVRVVSPLDCKTLVVVQENDSKKSKSVSVLAPPGVDSMVKLPMLRDLILRTKFRLPFPCH